jgi:lysyl-tRNA synthetase class 2
MPEGDLDYHFYLARKSQALRARARLTQSLRAYFINRDFLEVETPLRIPAPAPEEHIEAIPADGWFLQTSPELCMKRLLAAGYPRLFQISKCFRKAERGRVHLPEFTMLEWYVAGFDYLKLMDQCEELIRFAAAELALKTLKQSDQDIALAPGWEKLTVAEAFAKYAPVSMDAALAQNQFDEILVEHVEPRLGVEKPTFLYDYPASLAALAKLKDGHPALCERFELYIGGLEIANGFSELADAVEQRQRFEEALKKRAAKHWASYDMPEKFLQSLDALPPCAGIALGVDRLAMLCTGADKIDDVIAFPPEDL